MCLWKFLFLLCFWKLFLLGLNFALTISSFSILYIFSILYNYFLACIVSEEKSTVFIFLFLYLFFLFFPVHVMSFFSHACNVSFFSACLVISCVLILAIKFFSLCYLDLWFGIYHESWKILGHYFSNIFPVLVSFFSPSGITIMHTLYCWILSHNSWMFHPF